MAASLGILVIRSSLVDWWSMKKSADMRGTTTLYNTYYQWLAIYLVVQVLTTLYNTYFQWVAIYLVVQV
jgi:hypothetical protein